MIKKTTIKTAFLLPRRLHQLAANFGLDVLDIDYAASDNSSFRIEMSAYKLFSPDVVLDDMNPITSFATAFMKVPRVTMQRTGSFPGSLPCNPKYKHSMEIEVKQLPDVTFLGLPQPQTFADLFNANCNIIPGVPSIELLPLPLRSDPTYFFSGPLILEDYLMEQAIVPAKRIAIAHSARQGLEPLERFFAEHARRRRVYATFGTEAQAGAPIRSCLRRLLRQGVAVVTNIKIGELSAEEQQRCYFAPYIPMHFVCAHVDLMIHACGSGTYHYPILHQVPTITVGTQTYDREGVALRLEEIGVSVHLAAPEERADFEKLFQETVEHYFESNCALLTEMRHRMAAINEEISRVAAAFDLETVLQKAVR
jgi:UDP:flavonoid glycosyltransferase YjiC (YdhE family)